MEWISVKDRLPEHDGPVLCYQDSEHIDPDYNRIILWYDEGYNDFKGWDNDKRNREDGYQFVTHWMELPNDPTTQQP